MVKRVFGRVDGRDIELYMDTGNRWSVPVPFDADGEYVVEIIAEDEAGNRSYMAKILFMVNAALLCAHVEQVPFYGQLIDSVQEVMVLESRADAVLCETGMAAESAPPVYFSELIDPVCQERR